MTKTEAKKWLKAVRELQGYYRHEHNRGEGGSGCVFCKIAGYGCKENTTCLWHLFSHHHCQAKKPKSLDEEDVVGLRRDRNPRWVKLSLTRLKRWEKRLLEILEVR